MALHKNFENTHVVESPFVDEVANSAHGSVSKARKRGQKVRRPKQKSDAQDRKRRRKQGF